ncbi:NAD-binding protein [candidate division KSB1 bacterium]|nr:NAD-binding protein [candidate division KSB1 bacterium]
MPKQRTTGDNALRNHYVICNWSRKADIIVRQLHDTSVLHRCPIIVITKFPEDIPQTSDPEYRGILVVAGDPTNSEILERADLKHAKTVIVLAEENDPDNADSKTILTVLAIDSINPNAHVIVELLSSRNETYFQYTHADEIICLEQLAEKLLAQSALTPGLSQVYMDLLTQSADTNEIYQEVVPDCFIGKSYAEVEKQIIEIDDKDIILIGFSTRDIKMVNDRKAYNGSGHVIHAKKVIINPKSSSNAKYSKQYRFQPGDTIFMISYEEPEICTYLKNRDKNE